MTPPATKRPRSDDPSLPYLPPELLGKILAHAHLPYNRAQIDELGLNRDQRAYANLALRQIEEEYSPMVQVVKDTLARLQTYLVLETEGDNNRFQPHDANSTHPACLMTCWPRRWYFEDVTDASELRDQIINAGGSLMNADMCRAAAGPLEYCYSTPRRPFHEQDAKLLTVFVPQEKLPRGVTSARLSLGESLRDHYDNYDGDVDTLERTFCLTVRFVGGEMYNVSVCAEKSRNPHAHPDHYILRPAWVSTQRYGAAAAPLQADREKKGPLGPHASAVSLIVRQLLLMEQTRPFMYFGVGCLCSDWRRELIAAGVHRLGLPDLVE